MQLMADKVFMSWCRSVWTTHVFRSVLKVSCSSDALKGLTRTDLLKKIYLYGISEQFENISETKDHLSAWDIALTNVLKPIEHAPTAVERLALDWLRHRLTSGRVLALPDWLGL